MHGPDGDVVEEAESGPAVRLGVMARRPDEGEGIVDLLLHDGVHGITHPPTANLAVSYDSGDVSVSASR